MKRYDDMDHKNIFQNYSNIGKEISNNLKCEDKKQNDKVWRVLSKEGIWKLPIARKYGGYGLSWQDCVIALEGFYNTYPHIEFLTFLLSQISSLYLISQYGSEKVKKEFLPRLLRGDRASIHLSKNIHNLLPTYKKLNIPTTNTFEIQKRKIFIHADKVNNNIIFFIKAKKLCNSFVKKKQVLFPILVEENKFITNDIGLIALNNLINFERLFYGLLSTSLALKIKEGCNTIVEA